jgi:hypothetical protein
MKGLLSVVVKRKIAAKVIKRKVSTARSARNYN